MQKEVYSLSVEQIAFEEFITYSAKFLMNFNILIRSQDEIFMNDLI